MSKKGIEQLVTLVQKKVERLDELFALISTKKVKVVNTPAPEPEAESEVELALEAEESPPELSSDQENHDALFEQSNPINARAVIARKKKATEEPRIIAEPPLTSEQMDTYRAIFSTGEDPYLVLSKIIKHQNEAGASSLERKHANFRHRLTEIIPGVEFAAKGTMEEYRLAFEQKDEEKTKQLKDRLETFEHIQYMLLSLRSLSASKSQYTQNYFQKRLLDLKKQLDDQKVQDDIQNELTQALTQVVEANLYNQQRKRKTEGYETTPFDATTPFMELGAYKKRVKIEHKKNGLEVEVSGLFSYSRSTLLGQSGYKIWKSQEREYREFRNQIHDLVNVGISEYNKGSYDNPINIRYIGPSQPEAAVALLMEYKKRAIMENRVFHAKDADGKRIKITPNTEFTDTERKYFMDFALAVPELAKSSKAVNGCAGYQVFKHGVELEETNDPAAIESAMDVFLMGELDKAGLKLNERLKKVSEKLKETAKNNDWKDSARKSPRLGN